jgi:DEAD/DEAH box helicase domain-containing protein
LPQTVLDDAFRSRQHALDGFLGAAYALHTAAVVAVMAEPRDLQKAVGSGDGGWSAQVDAAGRGQLRAPDGSLALPDALERFLPTVYLYDNFPGGVGLSEPLFHRAQELLGHALTTVEGCACKAGCPGCVGPVLAADEGREDTPRVLATRVLRLLGATAA